MKKVNMKTYLMACAALTLMVSGCDNADNKVIDNAIYWEEASNAVATKITVDPQADVTASLTARIARALDVDVTAEIEIDPELLKAYNEANVTTYDVLPEQFCTYDKNIVIKAGEVAENINFVIKPYSSGKDITYALPVSIKTKGGVSTIGESYKYILLLNQPLIQSVPKLKAANIAKTDENTPWNVVTNEWSIEAWVQMDGFQINNQAIINSGSTKTEVYIRFGDAPIPFNSLQIKTMGSQVNTTTLFEPNKWYHIALTYNAAGLVTIYVNGVKDVTVQTSGGPAYFEQMGIVTSESWFRDTCMMAQLRLWKIAITPTQIQSNMYYGVRSDDPNLLGYWRLDEGEGTVFYDCTANKHDMTSKVEFPWIPETRFDK